MGGSSGPCVSASACTIRISFGHGSCGEPFWGLAMSLDQGALWEASRHDRTMRWMGDLTSRAICRRHTEPTRVAGLVCASLAPVCLGRKTDGASKFAAVFLGAQANVTVG